MIVDSDILFLKNCTVIITYSFGTIAASSTGVIEAAQQCELLRSSCTPTDQVT